MSRFPRAFSGPISKSVMSSARLSKICRVEGDCDGWSVLRILTLVPKRLLSVVLAVLSCVSISSSSLSSLRCLRGTE